MDVVVSGRHVEVSEGFKEHVADKIARLEKHDQRLIRLEVKVEKMTNRQPDRAIRVELTAKSRGPVVRAEASAEDKMAALDLALDKMSAQMRRAADRRKVGKGSRSPESVHQALTRTSAPRSHHRARGVPDSKDRTDHRHRRWSACGEGEELRGISDQRGSGAL
ncbi:MAG: ribosome-associated translation inhibitor RaiA [Marmoricola sp.]